MVQGRNLPPPLLKNTKTMIDKTFTSKNGILQFCSGCNKIHLKYKNLSFNFDFDSYENFLSKISFIHTTNYSGKTAVINLNTGDNNLNISFTYTEFMEFKELISRQDTTTNKLVSEIINNTIWN